ncbi:MAG: metallophosphoesterase [Chloroflexota bacterium]
MAVGDIHGMPAPDLGRLLAEQNPDIIVFGGDSLDNKQASNHSDEAVQSIFAPDFDPDKPMPTPRTIAMEIAAVRALIQWLIDNTNAQIIIMRGNHDNWIWRTVSNLLPVWAREFFPDILDLLIFGLPKDRVVLSNQVWTYHYPDGSEEVFGETKYLLVLGDAVLSHMNFTSVLPGGAVRKLAERMSQLYKPMGIADPVLLVQFHGHKVCNYDDRAGHRTCVEPGMGGCAKTEGYKADYNGAWALGAYGFVKFNQELREGEWLTDLSSVSVVKPRRGLAEEVSGECLNLRGSSLYFSPYQRKRAMFYAGWRLTPALEAIYWILLKVPHVDRWFLATHKLRSRVLARLNEEPRSPTISLKIEALKRPIFTQNLLQV